VCYFRGVERASVPQDSNDKEQGTEKGLAVTPNLTASQRQKIGALLDRWNKIQGRIKQAELISQYAAVPAINELRYAGRMLVAALSNTAPTERNGLPSIDEALIIASQYLSNAEHDISDGLVYFLQEKADDLNLRFGAETIRELHPNYEVFLDQLSKARGLIVESRSNLSIRNENYDEVFRIIRNASDLYYELVDVEVLFGLEVQHYKTRIFLWRWLAALAVFAGLSAWFYALIS